MFFDKTKTDLDNLMKLLSQRVGRPLLLSHVDISTAATPVTPSAATGFKNSRITVTGKVGTEYEQLGSANAYFDRFPLDQYVGRHGNKIFVNNSDTHESIVQKICDRLKISRSWVTYTVSVDRIPTGLGLESVTYTLTPAVIVSNNKIFSAGNPNIVAVNNGPLQLPLQPTLYFGGYQNTISLTGVTGTFPQYNTYIAYPTDFIFNNLIHGDESRSVNDSFILWLNNCIAPAARPYVKFTPENTEVRIANGTGTASLPYVLIRGKTADSPITQVEGIILRIRAKVLETSYTGVPYWVRSAETLEDAKEPIRKYLRIPRNQVTFTSFSKNPTTGVVTVDATNNSINPVLPSIKTVTFTLNP